MRDHSKRPDYYGWAAQQFRKNKAKILATQEVCYICGRPVDKTLKAGPWRASIDHIIPISAGGSPCDINNLALAHLRCNVEKGAKLIGTKKNDYEQRRNKVLPLSADWSHWGG